MIIDYIIQNPYEVVGFFTSVICVWLNAKENIWGWFFAIIAAGVYCKVFYDINLVGDFILQVIFIVLSIYGLYAWRYGGKAQTQLKIHRLPKHLVFVLLGIFGVSLVLVAQLLKWLNGDIVYVDAATTTISLIAQWMMARKYIENWLVWIFVDIIYVGVYLYKAVYLTAFLYVIFLFLATMGYLAWKKKITLEKSI